MQFDQIQVEYRFGIYFGVIALVLSIATGFMAGIPAGVIFIRGIIIAAVFSGIGFAVIMILKRFVPEVYEALSAPRGHDAVEPGINTGKPDETGTDEYSYDEPPAESGFSELTGKEFDRYETSADSVPDGSANPSQGKMGKHVVVQQQFNSYEPKIMAQAVRTMMSKDKD